MYQRNRVLLLAFAGVLLGVLLAALLAVRPELPTGREAAPGEPVGEATERLRTLFFAREFETGHELGRRLAAEHPDSHELRAWYALNAARAGYTEDGIAQAERLLGRDGTDPWSRFALAGALYWEGERGDEALTASADAWTASPDEHDFLWLRAETLRLRNGKAEAIELLDSQHDALARSAELLVVKGSALFDQAMQRGFGEDRMAAALDVFAEAREVEPANVNASYVPGWFLLTADRPDEAHPLLRAAAARSMSPGVHKAYWSSVLGRDGLTMDEKRAEILADIDELLPHRKQSPAVLASVAFTYGELELPERQKALEEQVLGDFPASREAEQVLTNRLVEMTIALGNSTERDADAVAEYREALRTFIRRPHHHEPRMLGQAHVMLFRSVQDDPSVSDDELFAIINGLSTLEDAGYLYGVHASAAIALAERKLRLPYAEQLVKAGMTEAPRRIGNDPLLASNDKERQRLLTSFMAQMQDALGWVYFNDGRPAEAEHELLAAFDADSSQPLIAYHLGRLYEAREEYEQAEAWYARCMTTPIPGDHPCADALRHFYASRHGDLSGFDEYLSDVAGQLADARQERIAESRLPPERPMPFRLETLDGQEISSAMARGKVTVINFWGLWCDACRIEMPDLTELAKKYETADDVLILTINNDPNADTVREWLQERGYDIEVLLDDGYVSDAGIIGFPTTWFIDKDGLLAFRQLGITGSLEEEFSARIEALRD